MRNEDRGFITLGERMELAAKSQATSPEAAARLVQWLSRVHILCFFCESANMNTMQELTGEFWDCLEKEFFHYGGFCHSFRLAIEYDNDDCRKFLSKASADETGGPVWGVRVNNALVLLGLILLDHAKGGMRDKNIYHCMRMTIKQYLDALVDLSFQEDGTMDEDRLECYWIWRKVFLKNKDGSGSLKDTLADILRRYIAAWREFDHLDHILRCMGALSCYLEQEEAGRTLPLEEAVSIWRFRAVLCQYGADLEGRELVETGRQHRDPHRYYFNLACEYPEDVPDPGSEDTTPGTLRNKIFLSERDYSPESLRGLVERSPFQDLQELLKKSISDGRLINAMQEINTAVTDLYMLFVEPYLRMGEYHYEWHLG